MTGSEKREFERLLIEYWRELRVKYPEESEFVPSESWRPLGFQLAIIAFAEEERSFNYNKWWLDNENTKRIS